MRNKFIAVVLISAAAFSTSAMAGKVNPEGLAGAGVTGSLVSQQAVVNTITNAIGGDVAGFLARLSSVAGVTLAGGGASFALNVDGKVYDVKVNSDGSVEATPRA